MAPLFAAVLAGVPVRIYGEVAKFLSEKYPDVMVLRGQGTKRFASELASYPDEYISRLLNEAADAVFGASGRPKGFCRLPHRDCAMSEKTFRGCGNEEGDQSCGRKKPENFLLIHQEAPELEEIKLLDSFYFSPSVIQISKDCYDHKTRTNEAIVEGITRALNVARLIKGNADSNSPSVLLPPENFGRKELRKLLRRAMRSEVTKTDYHSFRQEFFADNKYFKGRSGLAFEPAVDAAAHGIAGKQSDIQVALARQYRAGSSYSADFHWDISRRDAADLSGRVQFHCRVGGAFRPSGTHVNLLADDCVLGA